MVYLESEVNIQPSAGIAKVSEKMHHDEESLQHFINCNEDLSSSDQQTPEVSRAAVNFLLARFHLVQLQFPKLPTSDLQDEIARIGQKWIELAPKLKNLGDVFKYPCQELYTSEIRAQFHYLVGTCLLRMVQEKTTREHDAISMSTALYALSLREGSKRRKNLLNMNWKEEDAAFVSKLSCVRVTQTWHFLKRVIAFDESNGRNDFSRHQRKWCSELGYQQMLNHILGLPQGDGANQWIALLISHLNLHPLSIEGIKSRESEIAEIDCENIASNPNNLTVFVWTCIQSDLCDIERTPAFQFFYKKRGLKFSSSNLAKCSVLSLCILDLVIFLNAVANYMEEKLEKLQQQLELASIPLKSYPYLTLHLEYQRQVDWADAVHQHLEQKESSRDYIPILEEGLQVLRCQSNKERMGLEILIHLGRTTKELMQKYSPEDKDRCEGYKERCLLYWQEALCQLEKLKNGEEILEPRDPLFPHGWKKFTMAEVEGLIEEASDALAECQPEEGSTRANSLAELSHPERTSTPSQRPSDAPSSSNPGHSRRPQLPFSPQMFHHSTPAERSQISTPRPQSCDRAQRGQDQLTPVRSFHTSLREDPRGTPDESTMPLYLTDATPENWSRTYHSSVADDSNYEEEITNPSPQGITSEMRDLNWSQHRQEVKSDEMKKIQKTLNQNKQLNNNIDKLTEHVMALEAEQRKADNERMNEMSQKITGLSERLEETEQQMQEFQIKYEHLKQSQVKSYEEQVKINRDVNSRMEELIEQNQRDRDLVRLDVKQLEQSFGTQHKSFTGMAMRLDEIDKTRQHNEESLKSIQETLNQSVQELQNNLVESKDRTEEDVKGLKERMERIEKEKAKPTTSVAPLQTPQQVQAGVEMSPTPDHYPTQHPHSVTFIPHPQNPHYLVAVEGHYPSVMMTSTPAVRRYNASQIVIPSHSEVYEGRGTPSEETRVQEPQVVESGSTIQPGRDAWGYVPQGAVLPRHGTPTRGMRATPLQWPSPSGHFPSAVQPSASSPNNVGQMMEMSPSNAAFPVAGTQRQQQPSVVGTNQAGSNLLIVPNTISPSVAPASPVMQGSLVRSTISSPHLPVRSSGPSQSPFAGFSFQGTSSVLSHPTSEVSELSLSASFSAIPGRDTPVTSDMTSAEPTEGQQYSGILNVPIRRPGAGDASFLTRDTGLQIFESSSISHHQDDGDAPEDQEYDPHYDPIITLPESVDLATGDESEEVFKERAKLYRYDSDTKAWKEHGVGDMKILKDPETGRARILMRREQVLKVCANHWLTPEMQLLPMNSSERAWVWTAIDFAEGQECLEKFAIRFNTPELAAEFKKTFDKVKEEAGSSSSKPVQSAEEKPEEPVPETPAPPTEEIFDHRLKLAEPGWSLYTGDQVRSQEEEEKELDEEETRDENGNEEYEDNQQQQVVGTEEEGGREDKGIPTQQPVYSPPRFTFSSGLPQFGFVHTPNTSVSGSPHWRGMTPLSTFGSSPQQQPSVGFSCGGSPPGGPSPHAKPVTSASYLQTSERSPHYSGATTPSNTLNKSGEHYHEEERDDIYFEPVVTLPENNYKLETEEENEEIKFCQRAKLYPFDAEGSQWKERGVGDIKVLYNPDQHRIVMRRDQVFKVCANHYITQHVNLQPNKGSEKSWVWQAMDSSDGEPKNEQLAVRFKTEDAAREFKEVVDEAKKNLPDTSSQPAIQVEKEMKKPEIVKKVEAEKGEIKEEIPLPASIKTSTEDIAVREQEVKAPPAEADDKTKPEEVNEGEIEPKEGAERPEPKKDVKTKEKDEVKEAGKDEETLEEKKGEEKEEKKKESPVSPKEIKDSTVKEKESTSPSKTDKSKKDEKPLKPTDEETVY